MIILWPVPRWVGGSSICSATGSLENSKSWLSGCWLDQTLMLQCGQLRQYCKPSPKSPCLYPPCSNPKRKNNEKTGENGAEFLSYLFGASCSQYLVYWANKRPRTRTDKDLYVMTWFLYVDAVAAIAIPYSPYKIHFELKLDYIPYCSMNVSSVWVCGCVWNWVPPPRWNWGTPFSNEPMCCHFLSANKSCARVKTWDSRVVSGHPSHVHILWIQP